MNFAQAIVDVDLGTGEDVTLIELIKSQLGICDNDTSQDTMIITVLEMIGKAAEKYIDNKICLQSVSEQFKDNSYPIVLRYWPVNEVVTVILDGENVTDDWESYEEDGVHHLTRSQCGWSKNCCFDQLRVDYNAGYNPIPADLAMAITMATSDQYSAYTSGTVGIGPVQRESVTGVGTIEYATTTESDSGALSHRVGVLPGSTIAILELYRRYHA